MTTIQRHARAPVNPEATLFRSAAVAVFTLLFTPLIGASMVFANWSRLGHSSRGLASAIIGVLAVAGLGAFGWAVSPLAAAVGIGAGILGLAMGWYFEQRPLDHAHQQVDGAYASALPPAIAGLLIWVVAAVAWRML